MYQKYRYYILGKYQRHTLRERRLSTIACPACWAMGTNELKMVYDEEKYFELGRLGQPRRDTNLLYRHDKPNEPNKEGPLSFVVLSLKSPFTSVSTVSSAHPSLFSLVSTIMES
jgi:hypothetical protein